MTRTALFRDSRCRMGRSLAGPPPADRSKTQTVVETVETCGAIEKKHFYLFYRKAFSRADQTKYEYVNVEDAKCYDVKANMINRPLLMYGEVEVYV
jgi:hypothetical protein